MSFILDALKKSENERKRSEQPGFTDLPRAAAQPRTPAWALLALGALTSLVLVLGFAWWQAQPDREPARIAAGSDDTAREAGTTSGDDTARSPEPVPSTPLVPPDPGVRPLGTEARSPGRTGSDEAGEPRDRGEPDTAAAATPGETPVAAPEAPAPPEDAPRAADTDLPSANDLIADGALGIPDLHMDLHVYSATPGRRLVIVNGERLREGEAMNNGPEVTEILPDGVVMRHRGTRFVLPRD